MTDTATAPPRACDTPEPTFTPTPATPCTAPSVYYDGGCPVCTREIATYRRLRGGETIEWVDVHADADLGPGLAREAALRRLHVRLPDGRLVSGAAAFVEVWQRLPAFRPLAAVARLPGGLALMEGAYRAFLWLRPLWRPVPSAGATAVPVRSGGVGSSAPGCAIPAPAHPGTSPTTTQPASLEDAVALAPAYATWPAALRRELRTDHAGEAGAVMIYRGVLAFAREPALRAFAEHHLSTEARHLALVEAVVPPSGRSRLLPLWRVAGWFTGALPACLGPRAVYATIEAVETFVDRHYADQLVLIDHLPPVVPMAHGACASSDTPADQAASLVALRALLAECQQDEQAHRDDAHARLHASATATATTSRSAAWLGRAWAAVVGAGSAGAVRVSRWV